jgi:putative ABC transport system permease protein
LTEHKIFSIFSLLAIVIASIGLFGLASYSILQRMKEISIRKVLGAMPQHIFFILSKDFLKLIIISCSLSFPVAWFVMHRWLENFAYRTGLSWWIFFLAAIIVGGIALLTISWQAIKAAIDNPLKRLRSE